MSTAALDQFKEVLLTAIAKYQAMPQVAFVSAIVDMAKESGIEFAGADETRQILKRMAKLGSIDATAAMVVAGCSEADVAEAIGGITGRLPDVRDAMEIDTLTAIFEEFAEEEVAAGRMTKSICPETGRTLYGSVEKKG